MKQATKSKSKNIMEIEPGLEQKVDAFIKHAVPNIGDAIDIQLEKLSRDEVVATMPVDHRTVQPFGLLHGGASVVLAESIASIGAWLNVNDDQTAVGLEINANHIRPIRSGRVRGVARPIHRGAQTHIWSIEIKTLDGKLVCTSRCTIAVIKERKK